MYNCRDVALLQHQQDAQVELLLLQVRLVQINLDLYLSDDHPGADRGLEYLLLMKFVCSCALDFVFLLQSA